MGEIGKEIGDGFAWVVVHVFGRMAHVPYHGFGTGGADEYVLALREIPFGCLLAGCVEDVFADTEHRLSGCWLGEWNFFGLEIKEMYQ